MNTEADIDALIERLDSHMGQQDAPVLLADCRLARDALKQLRAERDAAARCVEFTKWAIQDSAWQGGDLDGGAVQDKAETLVVIVKVPFDLAKHKSDYAEPGDDWFEFAPDLPASAILATEGGS